MFRHRPRLAAALALSALLPGFAWAQSANSIQTPSHHIFCLYQPADGPSPASVRCDLLEPKLQSMPTPRQCTGEFGDAFAITANGARGSAMCHSDAVRNLQSPVLAYGAAWRPDGFTCVSRSTGLSCANAKGHGFTISREAQRVY